MSEPNLQSQSVQTTGHAWDGDLQEFNNPLPAWWVYTFYLTIAFAVVYWFIYPSWPFGKGYFSGIPIPGISKIEYVNQEGKKIESHWNTRALLQVRLNELAEKQKPYFSKVAAMEFGEIAQDPELSGFVLSAGKALFTDNCAPCHQQGGQGKIGFSPNLTDDDWLYGGTYDQIHQTLVNGRRGFMPAFGEVLSGEQIESLANYVASLSGIPHDAAKAEVGRALFTSETAACYYCHGENAKGRQDLGAPNLTDKIWLWADVPGAHRAKDKIAAIRAIIASGVNKGVMPGWEQRLSPEQIKVLTVYVHELGGGK